jgi:O-antigen ligase
VEVARPADKVGLWLLYALWFTMLFDPHWLLYSFGVPALQLGTVLYGLTIVYIITHYRRGVWAAPFLLFLLSTTVMFPFALNRGYARLASKSLLFPYLSTVLTLMVIRRAREVIPLLAMLILQYAWWGAFGIKAGLVSWHQSYANYDDFGPMMGVGIGVCYYFAMAARHGRLKWLAYGLAAICVAGVVSSFARGVAISAGLVAAVIWWRSPRKGWTSIGAVAAVIVVLVSTAVIGSGARIGSRGNWFEEISSMFSSAEDASESDRLILWGAALDIWKGHPLFGVGGRNFGTNAAVDFEVGEVGGDYGGNPLKLYDRTLHNIYVQILCEFGLVGTALFFYLLWDFHKKNVALRKPQFRARWAAVSGGRFDLLPISLGIEAGLIGWLAAGLFYNVMTAPYAYALLGINYVLYRLSRPPSAPRPVRA